MAKAKKIKDLDPKGRAKGVKGGTASAKPLSDQVGKVTKHVGKSINDAGKIFNRALNPRSR